MSIKQSDYESSLAEYSTSRGAIALLKQYPAYLEALPDSGDVEQSLITIPLPVVRIRRPDLDSNNPLQTKTTRIATSLPCDLGILMCDPEWQVKMGVEIIVFIHRPEEDFSDLINRWRQTQVYLDRDYEWLMPPKQQHIFSEAAEEISPLFVIFAGTSDRIKQGLSGAGFPFVVQAQFSLPETEINETILD
ncbi:hypothetical protein I4641_05095 [Waterburya agarophytonicola K14]|uniref:Uncharacterized protein n=1 Tax=Waterburya agarophytonicola KI4 TaxID=2874699 RepID=A0A964FEW6_9CYAN|nr:hypothetical protein [Waterburya agarophytonicola]MCC0176352.1 hypothetical protein [Waterburya agarophytonicola KI4]